VTAYGHKTKFDTNDMFFQTGLHRVLTKPFVETIYFDDFIEADTQTEAKIGPPMAVGGSDGGTTDAVGGMDTEADQAGGTGGGATGATGTGGGAGTGAAGMGAAGTGTGGAAGAAGTAGAGPTGTAGTTGAAGSGATGASGMDAAAGTSGMHPAGSSGCACAISPVPTMFPFSAAGFLLSALLVQRRRRGSR